MHDKPGLDAFEITLASTVVLLVSAVFVLLFTLYKHSGKFPRPKPECHHGWLVESVGRGYIHVLTPEGKPIACKEG